MKLDNLPRPTVKLVGEDGDAYSIFGRTSATMKRVGWTREQISAFTKEATSGDYNNLLRTVLRYCDEVDNEDEY